jgi:hypothetical protein
LAAICQEARVGEGLRRLLNDAMLSSLRRIGWLRQHASGAGEHNTRQIDRRVGIR